MFSGKQTVQTFLPIHSGSEIRIKSKQGYCRPGKGFDHVHLTRAQCISLGKTEKNSAKMERSIPPQLIMSTLNEFQPA